MPIRAITTRRRQETNDYSTGDPLMQASNYSNYFAEGCEIYPNLEVILN